jgi:hypothetical protein
MDGQPATCSSVGKQVTNVADFLVVETGQTGYQNRRLLLWVVDE